MYNLHRALCVLVVLLSSSSAFSTETVPTCPRTLVEWLGDGFPFSQETVRVAAAFAERHGLPTAVHRVGFDDRPRYRLYVGLDVRNATALSEYFQTFHAASGAGSETGFGGHLVLESLGSNGAWGNTPALRTGSRLTDRVWGAQGNAGDPWHDRWSFQTSTILLNSIVPLDRDRMARVLQQLSDPDTRDPVKTSPGGYCTAWMSNLVLGETHPPVPVARYHLASYLGFSRTIEHDELARCLTHAANRNHPVTFVLYSGRNASFLQNPNFLPPLPKRPAVRLLRAEASPNGPPLFPPAALEAARLVPAGAHVFFPIAAGTSAVGFEALLRRSRELAQTQASAQQSVIHADLLLNSIPSPALDEAVGSGGLKLRALFVGKNMIPLSRSLRLEVAPMALGQLARNIRNNVPGFRYDAIFVQTSLPDTQGRVSLGPNCDHAMDVIEGNPQVRIIAAFNRHVPFVDGRNVIPVSRIAGHFRDDTPLPSPAVVPVTNVERQIAANLASLVPDGATLQIGIGNVFGALPEAIRAAGRRNLRLWTELFGDTSKELLTNGSAVSGAASFAFGSEALYQWLPGANMLELRRASEIIDPVAVANIDAFHAMNSAFQVDLDGQVNAALDAAGAWVSSPGGQPEFMEGATRSRNGKAIIALRSTARLGAETVSRIAPFLYYGPVTTPWHNVTHVVTEYGVATLVGRSRPERAEALIRIAHPDFRAQLCGQAVRNGQLTNERAAALQR